MGGHSIHALGSSSIGMGIVGLAIWFISRKVGAENMPPAEIIGVLSVSVAMLINRGYSRLLGDQGAGNE